MSFEPVNINKSKSKILPWIIVLAVAGVILAAIAYGVYRYVYSGDRERWNHYRAWQSDPQILKEYTLLPGQRCGGAPFAFPTKGVIFGSWNEPYGIRHTHQGLDIFAGTANNVTPIYTAYAGYLTRLPDWRSALIIRIPSDPLQPSRQIWTYYTHMADESGNSFISTQFPAGTSDVFIAAGTLLGYQGNFSGDPNSPTGLHLHFSIVRDDGSGSFLNETDIDNTLDPTPYFNLPVNYEENPDNFPICAGDVVIEDWEFAPDNE